MEALKIVLTDVFCSITFRYVPPITSTSPNLPETPEEISTELRKQESLLSQIHSEMNAGFVNKKREEELWETQRIITQLKVSADLCNFFMAFTSFGFQRKLRTFEKRNDSMQKSTEAIEEAIDFTLQTTETVTHVEEKAEAVILEEASVPQEPAEDLEKVYVLENGFLMLHKDHPDYHTLIRLQLENQELMNWKTQLQARINAERAECVRYKRMASNVEQVVDSPSALNHEDGDYDKLIDHYLKENALLEQKRVLLAREIIEENLALIQLQVEAAMKQFVH